jgi:hypothetical protein
MGCLPFLCACRCGVAEWRSGGVAEWRHKLALGGTRWHRSNENRCRKGDTESLKLWAPRHVVWTHDRRMTPCCGGSSKVNSAW